MPNQKIDNPSMITELIANKRQNITLYSAIIVATWTIATLLVPKAQQSLRNDGDLNALLLLIFVVLPCAATCTLLLSGEHYFLNNMPLHQERYIDYKHTAISLLLYKLAIPILITLFLVLLYSYYVAFALPKFEIIQKHCDLELLTKDSSLFIIISIICIIFFYSAMLINLLLSQLHKYH